MPELTLQQAYELAVQHHQAGRFRDATALYRQILARQPNHVGALEMLARMSYESGMMEQACDLLRRAVSAAPTNPGLHSNLGMALAAAGRLDEALMSFTQALALRPDLAEAHLNLGNIYKSMGRLDEAIAAYRQALALRPGLAEAHNNLGSALDEAGQREAALDAFRQAVSLRPQYFESHWNLAVLCQKMNRLDESIAAYQRVLALKPDVPEALTNLGNALMEAGRHTEAIAAHQQAVAARPELPEAHNNLGIALHRELNLDEAIAEFRKAISLRPIYAEAHNNLGWALRDYGRLDEAAAEYRRALDLKPDLHEARLNLGIIALMQGDLLAGWPAYEARTKVKQGAKTSDFLTPQWDGASLDGKTILLHAEQGFGDTIQFVRYAPMVASRGGRVILQCPRELHRLLDGQCDIAEVIDDEPPPHLDVHCPLLSLPGIFATTLASIPSSIPYLLPDAGPATLWQDRLRRIDSPLKVGLCWAGRSAYQDDRRRSLSLSQFAPLASIEGVQFISLQKGEAAKALARTPAAGLELVDWTDELKDFADTAALMSNLDLVITVDTAVAHLAGALGRPVWVLLPFAPDWRWMLGRGDSPWYPTMRLFRQPALGDWATPLARVAEELRHA